MRSISCYVAIRYDNITAHSDFMCNGLCTAVLTGCKLKHSGVMYCSALSLWFIQKHSGGMREVTKRCGTHRCLTRARLSVRVICIYSAEWFNNNDYDCRVYDANIIATLIYIGMLYRAST